MGLTWIDHSRLAAPPWRPHLQVALEVLSKHSVDWFLWLDCDALVTNRSISIADFLQSYLVTEDAHFVVAEDIPRSGADVVSGCWC